MLDQNIDELTPTGEEFDFSEFDKETPSEKITVGGEEYTPEELAEYISKGKDYTKKTQELADQRRDYESAITKAQQLDGLAEAFERDPQEVIRVLSEQSGGYKQTTNLGDMSDYTENEKALYGHINMLEGKLNNALSTIKQGQWMAEQYAADQKAMAAVDEIEAKYGTKVGVLELRRLMGKHGISNPEAAWVYENRDSLRKAPETRPKPNISAPSSTSKVIPFDKWKDWGVEQIEASRVKGYVLEDRPKQKK